ncbi:MAG: fibronectin type III domain-containing protein [Rhodobacteraceae bacterium]|nr:fibronectin type III domain-containing protein [Paracoccaceae bacterium]
MALALGLAWAAPAAAQTSTKLVSNTGKTAHSNAHSMGQDTAQEFTTGSNTGGYKLTSVKASIVGGSGSVTYTADIFDADAAGEPTGTGKGTLTNPTSLATSGIVEWTATGGGIDLAAGTDYVFVLDVSASSGTAPKINTTASDDEDTITPATGWSIENSWHWRTAGATTWNDDQRGVQIEVHGYAKSVPAAPAAPNVQTGAAQGTLSVNWTAPANTGGNPVTDYDVRWKLSTANTWTEIDDTTPSTATTATLMGLIASTQYDVQVRAQTTLGAGPWSPTGQGTTAAPPATPATGATLVTNLGNSLSTPVNLANHDHAHSFTTGANTHGYALTAIVVKFLTVANGGAAPSGVTVKVGTGDPHSLTGEITLTNPSNLASAGDLSFTAPADTTLSAGTTYWVVIEGTAGSVETTWDDGQSGETGWSIANSGKSRPASSSATTAFSGTTADAMSIRVEGTVLTQGQTPDPTRPVILVDNQTESDAGSQNFNDVDVAQAFTTGGNSRGYSLTGIILTLVGTPPQLTVTLGTGPPHSLTSPITLINPPVLAGGEQTFTAPPNTVLRPGTEYFVVVEGSGGVGNAALRLVSSNAESPNSAEGWSIGNGHYIRGASSTNAFRLDADDTVRVRVLGAPVPAEPRAEPMTQKAWLARFGRTVTDQVVEAVTARLAATRSAGVEATLAGQMLPSWSPGGGTVPGAAGGSADAAGGADTATMLRRWMALAGHEENPGPGFDIFGDEVRPGVVSRPLSERDFLAGSSFALTTRTGGGGFASLWGRGAISSFGGREGDLTLDGEVTTGLLGADWSPEPGTGHWTAGLALGHSSGSGTFRMGDCTAGNVGDDRQGGCGGMVEATLNGLYPWAGAKLGERLSVWAAAGVGSGRVTVTPDGRPAMSAGLRMSMGAAGMRSEVLRPSGGNGFALALKGDARYSATRSEKTEGMAASRASVWLVRAGIEGSRPFALGDRASATPSFEIGLRLDGGDAERGTGADMVGGLAFSDPANGLSFDMKARGLLVHKVSGFRAWGASAAFAWDPRPETDRGPSLALTRSWGASPPSGGMDALLSRETLAGFAAGGEGSGAGGFQAAGRLHGEIGYGLSFFGGDVTAIPNLGFGLADGGARDVRIGWRLVTTVPGNLGFEASIDATRSAGANGNESPENRLALTGTIRW